MTEIFRRFEVNGFIYARMLSSFADASDYLIDFDENDRGEVGEFNTYTDNPFDDSDEISREFDYIDAAYRYRLYFRGILSENDLREIKDAIAKISGSDPYSRYRVCIKYTADEIEPEFIDIPADATNANDAAEIRGAENTNSINTKERIEMTEPTITVATTAITTTEANDAIIRAAIAEAKKAKIAAAAKVDAGNNAAGDISTNALAASNSRLTAFSAAATNATVQADVITTDAELVTKVAVPVDATQGTQEIDEWALVAMTEPVTHYNAEIDYTTRHLTPAYFEANLAVGGGSDRAPRRNSVKKIVTEALNAMVATGLVYDLQITAVRHVFYPNRKTPKVYKTAYLSGDRIAPQVQTAIEKMFDDWAAENPDGAKKLLDIRKRSQHKLHVQSLRHDERDMWDSVIHSTFEGAVFNGKVISKYGKPILSDAEKAAAEADKIQAKIDALDAQKKDLRKKLAALKKAEKKHEPAPLDATTAQFISAAEALYQQITGASLPFKVNAKSLQTFFTAGDWLAKKYVALYKAANAAEASDLGGLIINRVVTDEEREKFRLALNRNREKIATIKRNADAKIDSVIKAAGAKGGLGSIISAIYGAYIGSRAAAGNEGITLGFELFNTKIDDAAGKITRRLSYFTAGTITAVDSCAEEISGLNSKIRDLKNENIQLHGENDALRKELAETRAALDEMRNASKSLQATVDEMRAAMNEMRKEIDALKKAPTPEKPATPKKPAAPKKPATPPAPKTPAPANDAPAAKVDAAAIKADAANDAESDMVPAEAVTATLDAIKGLAAQLVPNATDFAAAIDATAAKFATLVTIDTPEADPAPAKKPAAPEKPATPKKPAAPKKPATPPAPKTPASGDITPELDAIAQIDAQIADWQAQRKASTSDAEKASLKTQIHRIHAKRGSLKDKIGKKLGFASGTPRTEIDAAIENWCKEHGVKNTAA